jgi:flagellar M-ring protein FliF
MAEKPGLSRLRQVWANMTPSQRTVVGGTVVALVIAVVVGSMLASRAGYAVLYSGLAPEEAGRIVEKLEAKKTPYKLTAGGTTIMIPGRHVYSSRIELASEGLPRSGTVGFEIFDKTVFGMTDFLQKVNYRRALEGELAKTIGGLEEVEGVRVHITVPERALFKDDEQQATASVVMKVNPARSLTARQIEGIKYLVASSVEGLNPDRVSILDSRGTLLSKGFPDQEGGASDGLELKKTVETYLEGKAQTLLDGVLGPGKAVVRVAAVLNLESIEREAETYDPESMVIRSEERSLASGGADNANNESSVTNYEINRTVERIATGTGNIERLSLGIVVDGNYETTVADDGTEASTFVVRSEEELNKIAGIVKNAVGFEADRQDEIDIACIAFNRDYLADEEQSMQKTMRLQFYFSIAKKVLYLGLVVLALIIFIKLTKRVAGIVGAASKMAPGVAGEGPQGATRGYAMPAAAGGGGGGLEDLSGLGALDPDTAASVISAMITAEGAKRG